MSSLITCDDVGVAGERTMSCSGDLTINLTRYEYRMMSWVDKLTLFAWLGHDPYPPESII